MDLVFPLSASHNDHIELKYCLRSVQRHLSDVGTIFIIGVKPAWIKDVTHIVYSDMEQIRYKETNIYRKTHKACTMAEVSEDFLFMNDDFYLLKDFQTAHFPFYYYGNLQQSLVKRQSSDPYQYTLIYTMKYLAGMRKRILDFDIHCPIIYNKQKYLKATDGLAWNRPYGFAIKSLYANMNDIQGIEYPDLKFRRVMLKQYIEEFTEDRYFFSSDERYINEDLIRFLNTRFRKKSKWEL